MKRFLTLVLSTLAAASCLAQYNPNVPFVTTSSQGLGSTVTDYMKTNVLQSATPDDARANLGIVTSNWAANTTSQFAVPGNVLYIKDGASITNLNVQGGNNNVWLTFNPTLYGAKGDNSTDDTDAFNAAIAAATAVRGVVKIEKPAIRYLISGPLIITNNVEIVGPDIGPDTISFTNTGTAGFLRVTNIHNIPFYGVNIKGIGVAGRGNGISPIGFDFNHTGGDAYNAFLVEDCKVSGFTTAIVVHDLGNATFRGVWTYSCAVGFLIDGVYSVSDIFQNCHTSPTTGVGYRLMNNANASVIGSDVNATNAFEVYNHSTLDVINCNCESQQFVPLIVLAKVSGDGPETQNKARLNIIGGDSWSSTNTYTLDITNADVSITGSRLLRSDANAVFAIVRDSASRIYAPGISSAWYLTNAWNGTLDKLNKPATVKRTMPLAFSPVQLNVTGGGAYNMTYPRGDQTIIRNGANGIVGNTYQYSTNTSTARSTIIVESTNSLYDLTIPFRMYTYSYSGTTKAGAALVDGGTSYYTIPIDGRATVTFTNTFSAILTNRAIMLNINTPSNDVYIISWEMEDIY